MIVALLLSCSAHRGKSPTNQLSVRFLSQFHNKYLTLSGADIRIGMVVGGLSCRVLWGMGAPYEGDGSMKKLVLLLSALLVLSAIASSPVLASRPSFEYRIQSLLAMFYQRAFPFSGVFIMPGETGPINSGGSWGGALAGDADDYGNGRLPGDRGSGSRSSGGGGGMCREVITEKGFPVSFDLAPGLRTRD